MRPATRHLALLVLLSLLPLLAGSCGGGADPAELTDEGSRCIGQDDYAGARAAYDEALAAIGEDTAHPEYLPARLGAVEARTKTSPGEVLALLRVLAGALPGKLTDRDYSRIAGRLGANDHLKEAVAVVTDGLAAFPDSRSLKKQIEALGKQAEASADPEALKSLQGLGYAGGK
ncbi:MAG: hypothetical protein AB1726_00190 [Planctomycetota bacterium]